MKRISRFIFFTGCLLLVFLIFKTPSSNSVGFHAPVGFAKLQSQCHPRPGFPAIQYGIVIDCGSTGSRIHVYRFNYCQETPTLEDEVFVHSKPGLSSYSDPIEAAKSLDFLLEHAIKNVPKSLYGCTPITVQATAGLRMLKGDLGENILKAVENRLLNYYPFPIFQKEGVAIMGGDKEGVFAWITVNYLLGNIGSKEKKPTAGIMDLGGGSTQIVFEPKNDIPQGNHKVVLEFASHKYTLYQHSYDGYGLMQGRKKIKEVSLDKKESPCVPENTKVELKMEEVVHELVGTVDGYDVCLTLIEKNLFQKTTICHIDPCSFEGVYMPSIKDSFNDDLYAFSYFFDKYAEPFAETTEFQVGALKKAATEVCSSKPKVKPEGEKELKKNPEWCIDLTFMYSLLSVGYGIPDDRQLKTAKKMDGIEIGWSLGAAIQMLDHQFQDPKFRHCRPTD
jgi:guanosine-diphosphatase